MTIFNSIKKLKFEKQSLKVEIDMRRLQEFDKKNTNYVILNSKRKKFSNFFLQTRRISLQQRQLSSSSLLRQTRLYFH